MKVVIFGINIVLLKAEEEENPVKKEGSLIKIKKGLIKKEETIGNKYIFIAFFNLTFLTIYFTVSAHC